MPDLTEVSMQMCESIKGPLTANIRGYTQSGLFSERHYPHCTCSAYKFKKRTINFGGRMMPEVCKHIEQAQRAACGWHQQYSPESQETEGVCPRCDGPAIWVQVGV